MRTWLFACALLLVGCDADGPYQRNGLWQPAGDNAGNIAQMLQNPDDLEHGSSARSPLHREGDAAVNRLWDKGPLPLTALPPSEPILLGSPQPPHSE